MDYEKYKRDYSYNLKRYVEVFRHPDDKKERTEILEELNLDNYLVYADYGPVNLVKHSIKPDTIHSTKWRKYTFDIPETEEMPILKYKHVYFSYPYCFDIYDGVFRGSSFDMRISEYKDEYFLEFKLDNDYSIMLAEMYFLREERDWLTHNDVFPLFNVLREINTADDMIL